MTKELPTRAHYKILERIIDSLTSSTNITFCLRYETVVIERRNSPYDTHEKIAVGYGHGLPRFVVINNEKFTLAITPYYPAGNFEGAFKTVLLPAFYVDRLFENAFPANPPKWVYEEPHLVRVTYLDPFSHFDENGKFVELPKEEQYVIYKTGDVQFAVVPPQKSS